MPTHRSTRPPGPDPLEAITADTAKTMSNCVLLATYANVQARHGVAIAKLPPSGVRGARPPWNYECALLCAVQSILAHEIANRAVRYVTVAAAA